MYQLTGSEVWSGGIPGSDPRPPLDRSVQGPWVDPLEREGVGGSGVEGGGGEEKKGGGRQPGRRGRVWGVGGGDGEEGEREKREGGDRRRDGVGGGGGKGGEGRG